MGSVNKVIILGNLGRDAEVKTTPNGSTVANFSLATTETWKGKDGQKQEKTEWHRVVLWGKTAEHVGGFLTKGKAVYIEGRLQTREWDKDGQKHYTTEVHVDQFQMLDSRGDSAGPTHKGDNNGFDEPAPAASSGGGGGGDFSDDIPFSRRTSNYSF